MQGLLVGESEDLENSVLPKLKNGDVELNKYINKTNGYLSII
mgnify:CR=1 FL=1